MLIAPAVIIKSRRRGSAHMHFEVQVFDWPAAMPLARTVREQVFIVEQGVPRELEWDEWDAASCHAVARDEQGRCIGTARLLPDGHLGRMAVLPEWRRRGVGTALALGLIALARQQAIPQIVLHAQTHAVPFYRKLGFSVASEAFEEAGIPHVRMALSLARDPG
jgi:predicted GNAT family N-acyltransferase